MTEKLISKEECEKLSKNRYVIRISEKSITYSDEFKRLFIDQYMMGKTPKEIFETHGFDVNIIGINRVKQSAGRWKKTKSVL
nr:HTH domain-containing protein [Paenibacillus dokdonensis]